MSYPNRILFFAVAFLAFIGCEKTESDVSGTVLEEGIWVEASRRKDTIVFQRFDGGSTWLMLNRGRELRADGYLLPMMGAGSYECRLDGGHIELYYTLSSGYAFEKYPFHYEGGQFRIGDFYEKGAGLKTFVLLGAR